MRGAKTAVVAACAVSLCGPAGALAGRAEIEVRSYVDRGGETVFTAELDYLAARGEANRLVLRFSDGDVLVSDEVGVTPGRGCTRVNADSARCSGPAADPRAPQPSSARVRLRDGADRAELRGIVDAGASLDGGPGADDLIAHPEAGALFRGGAGRDVMTGGDGTDVFDEGRGANGSDTLRGGGGEDEVDYGSRRAPVRADLAGDRDDGGRGERDRISADSENLIGGHAADRLAGNAAPNLITGGPGADLLIGGAGEDWLSAETGQTSGSDKPSADRLRGGPGADALYGSSGPNRIQGGRGTDTVFAGPGNDRVGLRDRDPDRVECDRGRDVALLDRFDTYGDDFRPERCERVRRLGPATAIAVGGSYPGDEVAGVTARGAELELECPPDGPNVCRGRAIMLFRDGSQAAFGGFGIERKRIVTVYIPLRPGAAERIRAGTSTDAENVLHGLPAKLVLRARDARGEISEDRRARELIWLGR